MRARLAWLLAAVLTTGGFGIAAGGSRFLRPVLAQAINLALPAPVVILFPSAPVRAVAPEALTRQVSVPPGGRDADGDSPNPAISSDGRFVAFESMARNLVRGDTNRRRDILVHDRQTGETTAASVATGGAQATDDRRRQRGSSRPGKTPGHEHTQVTDLIARGADLFFNETFNGNGRTCGTCHPAENNFTLDPEFIRTLPPNDPLFVAEFNPDLATLENPRLMRKFGLILENLDGFDKPGVMRGVPHTLSLSVSVGSVAGPRIGWSGDGAPGDASLRNFAIGAVTQHFPKTLNRVPGVDFRLPTDDELDAIEAFMLSLGRQADLSLPLPLKSLKALRGQEVFLDNSRGKCNICHVNAGANMSTGSGNANFNTGVEDLPDHPARRTGEPMPIDGGFGGNPRIGGGFGNGTFNVPPLVEAADTPPFFHNNALDTIEDAVAFYNRAAFNNSPAAEAVGTINLDESEVAAIAAFLRVINALENIRSATQLQRTALRTWDRSQGARLLLLASKELDDAIFVLNGAGLHPDAVALLDEAISLTNRRLIPTAMDKAKAARDLMIER